jgi:DNA-binding XRE family transcriptional regulator
MSGGIPNKEIDELKDYWTAFPNLKEALFISDDTPYSSIQVKDVSGAISSHPDIVSFYNNYNGAFPNGKSRIKDINPVLLGGELRRQRVIRGMSIKQVAEIIGISRKALYVYEEGTREMKVSTLYKLCQVYKTDINEVLSVSGS